MLERETSRDKFRMSMFSGAEYVIGYVVHEPPRPKEFFDGVVSDSYAPGSTFMTCLRLSRVFGGYSIDLIDRTLYRHESGNTAVTHLKTMTELRAAVQDQLGMPRCPIESAVAILERIAGQPFFGAGGAA